MSERILSRLVLVATDIVEARVASLVRVSVDTSAIELHSSLVVGVH